MLVPIFDFDGTLIDSDRALAGAFLALGVARSEISFGHELATECARLGITVDDYRDAYRSFRPEPFAGVPEMVAALSEWHIFSNKHGEDGRAEAARLGWRPSSTWFADSFDGPKVLEPVLGALSIEEPSRVVLVGDSDHDRRCAHHAGCHFILAGWNPRAISTRQHDDVVAETPGELVGLFDALRR